MALKAFSAALCFRDLTREATSSSSSDERTTPFFPRAASLEDEAAGLTGGGVGRLLVEGEGAESSSESESCIADLRLTPRCGGG